MKISESMKQLILLFGLLFSLVLVGKTQNSTQIEFDKLAYTVDSLIEKRAFEEALALIGTFDMNEMSREDKLLAYRLILKTYSPIGMGNFDSSIHYLNLSLPLIDSDSITALGQMELGNLLVFTGDFQNANQAFLEALKGEQYFSTALDSVQLYSRLAFTFGVLGQPEKQLNFLEKINTVLETTTDDFAKMIGYFDQINYYNSSGNGEKVKELLPYLKASGLKLKDSVLVSNVAKGIAICYRREDNLEPDSAIHYSQMAINYLSRRNIPTEKYNLKIDLANSFFYKKDFKKAIALCREAIDGLAKGGQGQSGEIGIGYDVLAWSLEESGQLKEAEKYFRKKLELNRLQKDENDIASSLVNLTRVLKAQGKTDELGDLYEERLSLQDSIYTRLRTQQVSEAETRLGLTLKEQQLENQNLKLEQQRKQRNWYLGLIALLSLLVVGAFLAYRRIAKDRKVIANQKEDLQQSLTEKEFLLKEIHHRVKNNLQIISSLLDKQARSSADQALKQMIHEGQDRIQSMALIHQNLYQSENLSTIQIQKYIQELTTNISGSQRAAEKNIEINLDVEPIQLDIDRAIPLGLILNELLTNSFKHGFKGQEGGQVNVQFKEKPNQEYELNFSDTGKGLPKDFDLSKARSLGLNLVNGLVQQLDGILDFESSQQGTQFSIQF